MAVSGKLALVADGDEGLRVIDVSDPTAPREIGSLDTPGFVWSVAVSGNLALVADWNEGLRVMDVSDPTAPREIGSLDTPGFVWSVAVSGNLALVADGNEGLRVIDVSDPTAPRETGFVDTPGSARGVAVSGNLALVADARESLRVIDVSDPATPREIGSVDTPGSARGVAVSGNLALVADAREGLNVIDISDPTAPREIGSVDTPGSALGVAVSGNMALVADVEGGLRVIDVSDPTAPRETGFVDTPGSAVEVAVLGNQALVADSNAGLRVIDISDPRAPREIGSVDTPGSARGVAVSGNLALLADGSEGLRVIDISDPTAPRETASVDTPGSGQGVAVSGNLALVADGNLGLRVIDVSDPVAPRETGAVEMPGSALDVAVSGNLALAAYGVKGLRVIDISDPTAPQVTAFMDTPGSARGVTVSGNLALVADGNEGLRVIDISDPTAPREIGSVDTPGSARGVTVSGNLALVADGNEGLRVIDISDPAAPRETGSVDTPGFARGVAVSGDLALVADGDGGLIVVALAPLPTATRTPTPTPLPATPVPPTPTPAPPIITTMAGTGTGGFSGDGRPATRARLDQPFGIAVDGSGNLYIADRNNRRVRRVDAATGVITTVAGNGKRGFSGDGGPALRASLARPVAVAVDALGNLYIADSENHRIRRVDARTGGITTVAGNGTEGFSGDGGQATRARLNQPFGVAVDGTGNLYIADQKNHRIRRVDARTGVITTVAGTGTAGFSGDGGPATGARLNTPWGVVIDGSGDLYIADLDNLRIRRVDAATGVITTVAGTGTHGFSGDGGLAASARLSFPRGLAVDGTGNLYIADWLNGRIRSVDAATGVITTVAGNGTLGFSGDGGPANSASLGFTMGVAVDGMGNLYIADLGNDRIRKVEGLAALATRPGALPTPTVAPTPAATATPTATPTPVLPIITTVAGNGTLGFSGDGGAATSASLSFPRAVAVDGSGNLYIADQLNERVRRVDVATGVITTVAGNGTGGFSGDGGLATSAQLNVPRGVAVDGSGNLYVSDSGNNRVRRVDTGTGVITTVAGNGTGDFSGDGGPATRASLTAPRGLAVDGATGVIATVAGNGIKGFSGDGGPATNASLDNPLGVAVDGTGNLYITDTLNHRIRRVDGATGIITTVAGNGESGISGDGGPATSASLDLAVDVAVDGSGNLYIGDAQNNRIRKVDGATGVITTVAGTGIAVFSGDGGPATRARLNTPTGIVVDGTGNLYIADFGNHRIRRVDAATGVITTVAGTAAFSGDGGLAISAQLDFPRGVAVDGSGNLYIADQGNNRIRRVDGGTGVITTVAGTGAGGFSGDGGLATSAQLIIPRGVALDGLGNLYISDSGNNHVRRVDTATGVITTVAGNGTAGFSGDGGPATSASLTGPRGLAMDSSDNLYVADRGNNRIRYVDLATGVITTVAGNGTEGFSGDGGPATRAGLWSPNGLAVGGTGNLYIADGGNNRIRRVDVATGVIGTVAGNETSGFSGDGGRANAASLSFPLDLAVDGSGNLYIADFRNHRVRKVEGLAAPGASPGTGPFFSPTLVPARAATATPTATPTPHGPIITTVAGNGTDGFSGDDGPATSASLDEPGGLAVDSTGNLYIVDTQNHRIRKVDAATGVITTVVGIGTAGFSGNGGPATTASLSNPIGLAVDVSGNLYIADAGNNRIRKVDAATGVITMVAGRGTEGFSGDGGPATRARLDNPWDVAVDDTGNLYIADFGNNRVRKVDAATGIISTVAGNRTAGFSGDGGPATSARLRELRGVTVDGSGNLYIADSVNRRIRRVDAATGIITTVAGSKLFGFSGDGGPATSASLSNPWDVAVDGSGNLYIADRRNLRIRRVDAASGVITTVSGTGSKSFFGDGGLATSSSLNSPVGVVVDGMGNLYISELGHHRVRKVKGVAAPGARPGTGPVYSPPLAPATATPVPPIITTVAGNGTRGVSGDGGPATSASLTLPQGLAVDGSGNLYISGFRYHGIRKVDTSGIISTVAGTGATGSRSGGFSGDGGPATSSSLNSPDGLAVDGKGNLYIADRANDRIRRVDAATGVITTVAGNGPRASSATAGSPLAPTWTTPWA